MIDYFKPSDENLSVKLIALLSFCLSLTIIVFDPLINKDGILYLLTAQSYLQSGLSSAIDTYSWPFFSIIFASVHQITTLPLHISGQIVVSLCFFLMSYAFVRLVADMGGSKRAQVFALIVISAHPMMSDYRSTLMRDPGMWAFMLLSARALLAYSKHPELKQQILWTIFTATAFLFRIEAIFIACLTPLSLLMIKSKNGKSGFYTLLRFFSLPALMSAIGLITLFFATPDFYEKLKLPTDFNVYNNLFSNMSESLQEKSTLVSSALLKHSAHEDSIYAVFAVFLTICFLNIFRALTPIYAAALIHRFFSSTKLLIDQNSRVIINIHLLIIGLYLFLFTLSRQFSLERYSFQLVILAALYLPFIFEEFWGRKKHYKILIAVVLVGYSLDTLINSDYKRAYINDAAQWIRSEIPQDATIQSNQHHIIYFSRERIKASQYIGKKYKENLWNLKPKVIYAYHAKKKEIAQLRKKIEISKATIIREFVGTDNGIVIIFRLGEESPADK